MKIFMAGNTLFPKYVAPNIIGGGFEVTDENISCWRSSVRNEGGQEFGNAVKQHKPFILESFYYADADTEKLIPYYGDFLLDSGAFTYFGQKYDKERLKEYVERYVQFINKNNIKKFFEMDVETVSCYDDTLYFRSMIEDGTGKQCIPVWHRERGLDEWYKSIENYKYVALSASGLHTTKWVRDNPEQVKFFIKTAHEKGAKIHGLGYTKLDMLKEHHFDSVDSTSWTAGNRFGYLYFFNGKTMIKKAVPKGKRFSKDKARSVALHNYKEWIKFQKYAEVHL